MVRDGRLSEIDAEEVVPGDLLVLMQGTRIATDALIIKAVSLQTDESALTGESFHQDKVEGEKVYEGTTVLFERAGQRSFQRVERRGLGKSPRR